MLSNLNYACIPVKILIRSQKSLQKIILKIYIYIYIFFFFSKFITHGTISFRLAVVSSIARLLDKERSAPRRRTYVRGW